MNNLPYNHDMRESLLQKSLFSLSRYLKLCKSPHAGPSLCQEYCMPVGRKKKKRTRRKESVCPFERTGGSVTVGLKDSCCHSQEPRFSRPLVWATSDSSSKLSASSGRRPIPSSCTSLLQVWALGCSQGSLMPLQVLMDSSKSRNAPSHHLLLRQPRGRYLKDAAQKYSICCSRSGHQVLQGQ